MKYENTTARLFGTDRGMVALQKRSPKKDTFPEMWEIGGHRERGRVTTDRSARSRGGVGGDLC